MARLLPSGDGAILVSFAGEPDARRRVAALDAALTATPFAGLQELVPGIDSLLVVLDGSVALTDARARLQSALDAAGAADAAFARRGSLVTLQVRFGGGDGPDLDNLAVRAGVRPDDVVAMLTAKPLDVAIVGHLPGLPYLTGLPAVLDIPRLEVPRIAVEAGSVGVAAAMACVYPIRAPGGWHIVGRTDAALVDPRRDPPFLLAPGDRVQFVAAR